MWIDIDKWREILDSISRHKLRTTLTALGVFWGIFMLVLLLGAGTGLSNGVEYEFRDDAINSIWISPGITSKPWKGLPEGRRLQLTNQEFNFLRELEEVGHITGRYYPPGGDQTVTFADNRLSFPLRSVHPGHEQLENTQVVRGRYINEQDLTEHRKVAIVGNRVREDLFGEVDPIGQEITIGDAVFKVVGLYEDTGSDYETRIIYIPVTTAQKMNGGTRRLHRIMFTTGEISLERANQLEEEVRQLLADQLQFDPSDRRAVWINNRAEEYQSIQNLLAIIRAFVWLVSLGSIFAGAIGISNIMLIVVKDRTREIGLRKAMGATPGSIISMVLSEAILITVVAGYLGVALGVMVIHQLGGIESGFFRNPEVPIGIVLSAFLVLIITGVVAGWLPANRAAQIHPVEAMRN